MNRFYDWVINLLWL